MSRETFSTFVDKLLEKTLEAGHVIDFSEVPSWYYPRYFFSGSWNRVLDKAKVMEGNYVPAGPIPYSDDYMYSPTRVPTLVEFLHDLQCVVLYGYDVVGLLNPTDKVKPFFTQLNAIVKYDDSNQPDAIIRMLYEGEATGAISLKPGTKTTITDKVTAVVSDNGTPLGDNSFYMSLADPEDGKLTFSVLNELDLAEGAVSGKTYEVNINTDTAHDGPAVPAVLTVTVI